MTHQPKRHEFSRPIQVDLNWSERAFCIGFLIGGLVGPTVMILTFVWLGLRLVIP